MARLKTFVTSDGLTDFIVAATSRPKALAAWGVRQDLFKQGTAREIDDPQVVKAAAKTPGVVLERPAGGRKGPIRLPKSDAAPKLSKARLAARRRIEALEAERETLEAQEQAARASLQQQRADLDAQEARLDKRFATLQGRLGDRLAAARRKA